MLIICMLLEDWSKVQWVQGSIWLLHMVLKHVASLACIDHVARSQGSCVHLQLSLLMCLVSVVHRTLSVPVSIIEVAYVEKLTHEHS